MSTPIIRRINIIEFLFIFFIFSVFIFFQFISDEPTIKGKVVGIIDGDTIHLMVDDKIHKIRLSGIDAPEKTQDFGQKSKQSLSDMIYGRDVTAKIVETDRYGRDIATIFMNGQNINQEQVRRGMAWTYTQYNKDTAMPMIEEKARKDKTGLWSMNNPVAPWDYRKK